MSEESNYLQGSAPEAPESEIWQKWREAQARIAELEAHIQNARLLSDEMNGRLGDLLEAYEEVVAGNQALSQRAETAAAERDQARKAMVSAIAERDQAQKVVSAAADWADAWKACDAGAGGASAYLRAREGLLMATVREYRKRSAAGEPDTRSINTYLINFIYHEPKPAAIPAQTAREAAEAFFAMHGGLKENYGRSIAVTSYGDHEKTTWSCIRLFGDDAAVFQTDEAGQPLPGQPKIEEYEKIYPKEKPCQE